MRLVSYRRRNQDGTTGSAGLALNRDGELTDLGPLDLGDLLRAGRGALAAAVGRGGPALDPAAISYRPLLPQPGKVLCIGLNYVDHAAESPYVTVPDYPAIFPRFSSSLIGHGEAIVRPVLSDQLDFEGEVAVIIGTAGRHIAKDRALAHVAGYSVFNDASIRDYQFKSAQWTVGKNFDDTGAFGPDFVSADELPAGARGLKLETRLNGQTVQSGNTADMCFDVATLISIASQAMTLQVGDVIVTGTPAGVGFARKPPLFMRDGDVCEVEIEGIGTLRNPIRDEIPAEVRAA
ncbi:fumarylacetoacetate hydrolase family protein [Phreatobacter stygius]|uniref:Fumarylacetoacetate hydrolase family protein n=1 Tax=Phreatobacter stygius TaxID=1940610 RepID=A0A4D7B5X4_9HYPH|nr:fumarylacetoacetate hydrolase family protein [Phreatobacter stygius]QCI63397.1 fumarylacetoacetate hydrolase family protein [Phreatobacter stygius]